MYSGVFVGAGSESLLKGRLISTNISPESWGESCGMIRLFAVLAEFVVNTKSLTLDGTECTRSSQKKWMWYYIFIQPRDLPFLPFSPPSLHLAPAPQPLCPQLNYTAPDWCLSIGGLPIVGRKQPHFSYPARYPLHLSTKRNHTSTPSTH